MPSVPVGGSDESSVVHDWRPVRYDRRHGGCDRLSVAFDRSLVACGERAGRECESVGAWPGRSPGTRGDRISSNEGLAEPIVPPLPLLSFPNLMPLGPRIAPHLRLHEGACWAFFAFDAGYAIDLNAAQKCSPLSRPAPARPPAAKSFLAPVIPLRTSSSAPRPCGSTSPRPRRRASTVAGSARREISNARSTTSGPCRWRIGPRSSAAHRREGGVSRACCWPGWCRWRSASWTARPYATTRRAARRNSCNAFRPLSTGPNSPR